MSRQLVRLAVFAFVCSFVGCATKPAPPAAPAKAEAKVKAGELIEAFTKNALKAETLYKGKVIQVTGKVGSVQKVIALGYDVQVLPEDAPAEVAEISTGVHCFISEAAKEEAAKLNPGDKVTMQGMCDGSVIGGQIKVSKCTVVK